MVRQNERNRLIKDNLWIVESLVNRFAIGNRFIKWQTIEDWKQRLGISVIGSVDAFLDGSSRPLDMSLQQVIYKHAQSRLVEIAGRWFRIEGRLVALDDVRFRIEGRLVALDDVDGTFDVDPKVEERERLHLQELAEFRVRRAYPNASEREIEKRTDRLAKAMARFPPPPQFPKSLSPSPASPPDIIEGVGRVQVVTYALCQSGESPNTVPHPQHKEEMIERKESQERTKKITARVEQKKARALAAAIAEDEKKPKPTKSTWGLPAFEPENKEKLLEIALTECSEVSCLSGLTQKQREIAILRGIDLTEHEVASVMGVSQPAIHRHLDAVRKKLRPTV
jgi:hypothetical protein